MRFSIELDEEREREMYGLGGGFELSTAPRDLATGMFGDRFGSSSGISSRRPKSSVSGRGGALSTMASSN